MKILLIGNANNSSKFVLEYLQEIVIKIPDITVDLMSTSQKDNNDISYIKNVNYFWPKKEKIILFPKLPHPHLVIKQILRYILCRRYDIIHILSVSSEMIFMPIFFKRKSRIIISYFGSDLMSLSKRKAILQKILVKRANVITVSTENMLNFFNKLYNYKYTNKIKLATFGSNNTDIIIKVQKKYSKNECKMRFNIPSDRISILCGYNGNSRQKHKQILEMLSLLNEDIKKKIYVLLQCSYGATLPYINELSVLIEKYEIMGQIIIDYLNAEDLAKLRISTDIMLNVQPSDALSASMLECLEVGAVIIKGSWLKYEPLESRNIFMLDLESILELPEKIIYVVKNFNELKNKSNHNKGILYELLSWKTKKFQWQSILLGKIKN